LSSVMLLGFFTALMTQSAIPALSALLLEEWSLSASRLGLLMSAYFLAFGMMQVPAGAFAAHWGGRVALAGFAALALGDMLLLVGQDYTTLVCARVIQGFGAAVMLPTAGALSSRHIRMDKLGRGWSITGMGAGFGNLFALIFLPRLAVSGGLVAAFAVMLAVTGLAALVSARLPEFLHLPLPRTAAPTPASIARNVKTIVASRGVAWLALVNLAAVSFGVGVVTWTPLFSHDLAGASVSFAALLTAGYAAGQLAGAPLVGLLITRIGHEPLLIVASVGMCLCGVVVPFATSWGPILVITVTTGVLMAASFAPSFALIPRYVGQAHAALASGVISGIAFLGALTAPWLFGLVLDWGWGFRVGYALLSVFATAGIVASIFLAFLRARSRPEC